VRLYIDLVAQAAYIETDGNDVLVDTNGNGWTTKQLLNVIKPNTSNEICGIELLHIDSVEIVGKCGTKRTWSADATGEGSHGN